MQKNTKNLYKSRDKVIKLYNDNASKITQVYSEIITQDCYKNITQDY